MAETIEGKVVVVTGSGGGIGSAICKVFHEAGAAVVPFYRDRAELNFSSTVVSDFEKFSC